MAKPDPQAPSDAAPLSTAPYPYRGDAALQAPVQAALRAVVDPESALSIVDMGLVVSVDARAQEVHVRLVMTSAACPVADLIVEDAEAELDRVLPHDRLIRVERVDTPAWTPERLSPEARRLMRW